jgi:hypothetical protein
MKPAENVHILCWLMRISKAIFNAACKHVNTAKLLIPNYYYH